MKIHFRKGLSQCVTIIAVAAGITSCNVSPDTINSLTESLAQPSPYSSHGYASGYYPYSQAPSQASIDKRRHHAFDVGKRVGADDYHHGKDKRYVKHPDLYDSNTQDAFKKGYYKGYEKARDTFERGRQRQAQANRSAHHRSGYSPYSPAPTHASSQSRNHHAYDIGYRVGQDDFHAGRSKHYPRHGKLYDSSTRDSFKTGYVAGYNIARSHAKNR